ncbi:MAG: hypothetical protein DRJ38_09150 [Thermoprotei archaeon]|nr:MAG: hypothetical protein DRJ38_09150 [Thermoprotei archaeon]
MLEDLGYLEAHVGRRTLLFKGKLYEINVFCEDPLVVGEATLHLKDVEEAKKGIDKLIKRIKIAEKTTGKKVFLKLLAVGRC